MPKTFYHDACNVDARMSPFPPELTDKQLDAKEGLSFFVAKNDGDGVLSMPHSIMNDNVAINYRTIYNGYPMFSTENDFTLHSDYERCMMKDQYLASFLRDRKNPTYKNIITYYGSEDFDPYGLARYKMQDFIYLKYYNQIPNNQMVTLRRYTRPCTDHMFGLDMLASDVNAMNNYFDDYIALATAVTYMGEQTGNKLSDILKFEYGANWEDREGKVTSLQNPDGGLAAQLKKRGVSEGLMGGEESIGGQNSVTSQAKSLWMMSAMAAGKNVSMSELISSQHRLEGDVFAQRYGESLYGDVNVVNKVKMRSRGLTFTNNFSLNFEYSLKSLKCVNPRIAMMDILSNFLILTGNYGTFWGGETIFYGNRNIAPQYGDPNLLREGRFGEYLSSLAGDVKEGFKKIAQMDSINGPEDFFKGLWNGIKNVGSGFLQGLMGNLLGGNIGVAGEGIAVPALLSGNPSGFWHVTVGNPLDPIAMMGNMAVTSTSVQFGDMLGYDDFPTEIKFTVNLEHCMPRDNAHIESMFNGGKGRFYSFTNADILNAYKTVDTLNNFEQNNQMSEQQRNKTYDIDGSHPKSTPSTHSNMDNSRLIKLIGGHLNA